MYFMVVVELLRILKRLYRNSNDYKPILRFSSLQLQLLVVEFLKKSVTPTHVCLSPAPLSTLLSTA